MVVAKGKENEKLNELFSEQALERDILKDLLKNEPTLAEEIEIAQRYMGQGSCISFVLLFTEVEGSSYYAQICERITAFLAG